MKCNRKQTDIGRCRDWLKSRMRENRTYGSVRGIRHAFHLNKIFERSVGCLLDNYIMKHYKKIIAAIAATALTISVSATSVTAFADELEEDVYLAGIEDVETQEIAEYYLDNGCSIDEAQAMLAIYEDGLETVSADVLSGSGPFHIDTNFYNSTRDTLNKSDR